MLSMYRAPKEAIDLISQFLKINPKERISATKALDHEYFKKKFESKRGKF
jgi:serine/threonine protein kinase